MPFSRISSIISLIPFLIPTATLAIPKIRQLNLNTNVRTTTIVSSSTTTFLAISTEYSTPATYSATSATPPPMGPPWATKPWFPPTYTWKKSETTGTTSFFNPTPANTSSTFTESPEHTTHEHSPAPPPSALTTHNPQIPGREIHPNWNSRWCLIVRARTFVDGMPVEIGRCAGSLGEHWEFSRSPGRTRIRVAETNFCLDGEIDSVVRIRMCNAEVPSQDWYVTEDDRFALTGTGRCLDRLNGGLSPRIQVQTYECINDNTNQVWTS